MKPSNIFAAAGKFLVLVILYIVVFSASGQFFVDDLFHIFSYKVLLTTMPPDFPVARLSRNSILVRYRQERGRLVEKFTRAPWKKGGTSIFANIVIVLLFRE